MLREIQHFLEYIIFWILFIYFQLRNLITVPFLVKNVNLNEKQMFRYFLFELIQLFLALKKNRKKGRKKNKIFKLTQKRRKKVGFTIKGIFSLKKHLLNFAVTGKAHLLLNVRARKAFEK